MMVEPLSATTGLEPVADPFDLWATPAGVAARERFYAGHLAGKAGAVALGLADWLVPTLARRAFRAEPRRYAITLAQVVLTQALTGRDVPGWAAYCAAALEAFERLVARGGLPPGAEGWGHGFPWMSKNGLYPLDTPLMSITPYVMEALLVLAEEPSCRERAMALFRATRGFLESLRVMEASGGELALSYAPRVEPRIVINANAYAAFAHALHAIHGEAEWRKAAADRARHLVRWVVARQEPDGRWPYYADGLPGNFVDGFHSCFVLKNLRRTAALLEDLQPVVAGPLAHGWAFLRERFYDARTGLCRRFIVRDIKDPFRWDLYDQAEYLGQLVDRGELEAARRFQARVEHRFRKGDDWYCRIDFLGRRWGRNFLRWGPAPFVYHRARLDAALGGAGPARFSRVDMA